MKLPQVLAAWQRCWHAHGKPARHAVLRVLTAAFLVVYCGWQVFWLSQGCIPPALFLALTGLPAPTTGGTRSMMRLVQGDWRASLHHNAFALPMTLLFGISVGWLLTQGLTRRAWRLPNGFLVAWLALLGVAWMVKLLQYVLAGTDQAL